MRKETYTPWNASINILKRRESTGNRETQTSRERISTAVSRAIVALYRGDFAVLSKFCKCAPLTNAAFSMKESCRQKQSVCKCAPLKYGNVAFSMERMGYSDSFFLTVCKRALLLTAISKGYCRCSYCKITKNLWNKTARASEAGEEEWRRTGHKYLRVEMKKEKSGGAEAEKS